MIPGAQRNCVTFSNKQTNPKTDCAVTDFKTANNMTLKKKPTVIIKNEDEVNSEFIYPSRSATIDKLSHQVIY